MSQCLTVLTWPLSLCPHQNDLCSVPQVYLAPDGHHTDLTTWNPSLSPFIRLVGSVLAYLWFELVVWLYR